MRNNKYMEQYHDLLNYLGKLTALIKSEPELAGECGYTIGVDKYRSGKHREFCE